MSNPDREEGHLAVYRAGSVVTLLVVALASVIATVGAEETTREARIEATIPRIGNYMGVGFNSVWIMSGGKLARINIVDNSITDIAIDGLIGSMGTFSRGIAVGEGAIWVPDVAGNMVYKIDPQTNQVVQKVTADMVGGGGSIGAGEGALWVITGAGGNVLRRYSADGGAEEAKIPLPSHSSAALVAFGSIWITGTGNDELYRIDPTTNQIAATIELDSRPVLAAGEGSVWVFNQGTGNVQRIDGESSKLLATIQTGAVGKGAIAVGGGFVWLRTHLVPIIQIDPRTNSVLSKFDVETVNFSTICYAGGSLWVSGTSVRRVSPPE